MLGAQDQIARPEPLGGAPMQFAALRPEQGIVHRVPDQGVGEQEVVACGSDQKTPGQRRAVVVRVFDQMPQRVHREALA